MWYDVLGLTRGPCPHVTSGRAETHEVSTMSDFDRNAAAAQYGRSVSRTGAVVVDEGLRAYMLRIYNYMALGLAITGFAALGAYMLAVTTDPSQAVQGVRLANGVMLTSFGYAIFVSPLKWVIFL